MDANLREMGVGDLAVPKRMRSVGEAFYGRVSAYDSALDKGAEALAEALCRNVLDGRHIEHARRLSAYVSAVIASLSREDDPSLLAGSWSFPSPVAEDV
jgi:cytochrome b pre-mRNA-processing protein 3